VIDTGSRFFVTGVQLGMIIGFLKAKQSQDIENLVNEILDKQYIGEAEDLKKMLEKYRGCK